MDLSPAAWRRGRGRSASCMNRRLISQMMLQKVKKGDLALGASTRMFRREISSAPRSDASDVGVGEAVELGLKGCVGKLGVCPFTTRAAVLGNWA